MLTARRQIVLPRQREPRPGPAQTKVRSEEELMRRILQLARDSWIGSASGWFVIMGVALVGLAFVLATTFEAGELAGASELPVVVIPESLSPDAAAQLDMLAGPGVMRSISPTETALKACTTRLLYGSYAFGAVMTVLAASLLVRLRRMGERALAEPASRAAKEPVDPGSFESKPLASPSAE
jgi:hypothetical protein